MLADPASSPTLARSGTLPENASAALLALMAVLVLAIYYHALSYPFNSWDDYAFYLDDPATHALTLTNLKAIFTEPRISVWYPLARLSHAIDFALFGANAFASRLVNVALHLANSLLVFAIALRCLRHVKPAAVSDTQCFFGAAFAGLLFCVHPQHVETVVWISQRKELLSALGFLGAVYLYLRYSLGENKVILLVGVFVCGILAMLGVINLIAAWKSHTNGL